MKIVIITIFIYSFFITLVDIYKDNSSYSMGLDGPIDIIIAGPCMWILCIFLVLARPFYKIYRKKFPKKKKEYTDAEIERTVKKFFKVYRRIYGNKPDHPWVVKEGYYDNLYIDVYKPYDLKLKKFRYERLEKKYLFMCYNYADKVWEVIQQISHPITESKDWKIFKENSWKTEIESLVSNGAVEI